MLCDDVKKILRESQAARKIVQVLYDSEGFLGFYGEDTGIGNGRDYKIHGIPHREVIDALWRLEEKKLLDSTYPGFHWRVYCFNGENKIVEFVSSEQEGYPSYKRSHFTLKKE